MDYTRDPRCMYSIGFKSGTIISFDPTPYDGTDFASMIYQLTKKKVKWACFPQRLFNLEEIEFITKCEDVKDPFTAPPGGDITR